LGKEKMSREEAGIKDKMNGILEKAGNKRQNLIPILQQTQEEFGYLPPDAMLEVARFLNIPEIDVYSVATFYNQFRLTPPGKHSVRVCMGTACHVKGGHITLAAWQRRLKIEPGQTTTDREFDLDTVACVGCCAMAPVTVVDRKVEAKADPTRVDGILLQFQLQKEKEDKAND
jgi:NADH-quinone oxidoreductase subunit E